MRVPRLAIALLVLGLGACAHSSLTLLPDEAGGNGAVALLEANGQPMETVVSATETRTRLGDRSPAPRPIGEKGLNPGEQALLAALPAPASAYVLYFVEGTTEVTPESRPALDALRQDVASRAGVEVEVTGYTDTVGSEEDNDALSLRRAEEILSMLAGIGIDRSLMTAVGRGERELRQPTADNVESAINRRVEVLVR